MYIKFLGAAGTVTGSSYILTSGSGQSILIDLGMFQGTQEIDELNYKPYDYDLSKLLGAVLTHAHLDHCGRLPILSSHGFRGPIWMTDATADLTELSLLDSAKIAEKNSVHALYDTDLAIRTIDRFSVSPYHEPINIGDFVVTFHDAGHILGSASLEIEDTKADYEIKKIVFSGDLGNTPEDIVRATEYIESADAVVMESTYGNRLHPDEDPSDIIQSEINAIEKEQTTLLIPAFSMDRTQEILHRIKHLKDDGKIQANTSIYLDGPMAQKATAIYLGYPKMFNEHIQSEMGGGGPFDFPGLTVVRSHQESERLRNGYGPKVIIAGSGMMTGGRILGHASYFLPDSKNRLLIVGYQGEETLGREILEGAKLVKIDEVDVPVNASVNTTHAMSSHADQGQLLDWLKHISGVKKLFLTHGEDDARKVLAEKVKENLGISDITMPHLNEETTME
jgi:metallo-beta-lactamase family protein